MIREASGAEEAAHLVQEERRTAVVAQAYPPKELFACIQVLFIWKILKPNLDDKGDAPQEMIFSMLEAKMKRPRDEESAFLYCAHPRPCGRARPPGCPAAIATASRVVAPAPPDGRGARGARPTSATLAPASFPLCSPPPTSGRRSTFHER